MNSDVAMPLTVAQGHPALQLFASFPIACFTCALATDIAYLLTANMMWADFSAWLLAIGMAGAVLAAIVGIVVLITGRRATSRPVWPVIIGSLLVLGVAFMNNLVHSRDAWTSVVPTGLGLSIVTVVIMLATLFLATGSSRARRRSTRLAGANPGATR